MTKNEDDDQANVHVGLIVMWRSGPVHWTRPGLSSLGAGLRRRRFCRRGRRGVAIGRRSVVVLHRHRAGAGVGRCAPAGAAGGTVGVAAVMAIRCAVAGVTACETSLIPAATAVRVTPVAPAAAAAMPASRFRIGRAQHEAEGRRDQCRQNQGSSHSSSFLRRPNCPQADAGPLPTSP